MKLNTFTFYLSAYPFRGYLIHTEGLAGIFTPDGHGLGLVLFFMDLTDVSWELQTILLVLYTKSPYLNVKFLMVPSHFRLFLFLQRLLKVTQSHQNLETLLSNQYCITVWGENTCTNC